MEILLIQDVENLGQRGDRVNVAKGHFRNLLGPKGLAVLATEGNRKAFEEAERVHARKDKKNVSAAEAKAAKLGGISLEIPMQVNEEGHLYGSVTEQTLAKLLEEKGHAVSARQVRLEEHIKELGEYTVPIELHRDVSAEITVKVVAKD
jgi:large subunit ribosomal protein L9